MIFFLLKQILYEALQILYLILHFTVFSIDCEKTHFFPFNYKIEMRLFVMEYTQISILLMSPQRINNSNVNVAV